MPIVDLCKQVDEASASWEAGLAIVADRLIHAFVTDVDKRSVDKSKLRPLAVQTVSLPEVKWLDTHFKRCRKAFKTIHSARPDILKKFDRRSLSFQAWLRQILLNEARGASRRFQRTTKRDIQREVALEAVDIEAARRENPESPSKLAVSNERMQAMSRQQFE